MELTRLKELTATLVTEETVLEASKAESDFSGIARVVDDALADLKDKLGKGGNLATLFKSSGASKLDTVKDDDGKNVLAQIIALTTDYRKAIEKLLMEAELLVNQASMNEGLVLSESKDYSDSSEFTDEFYTMMQQVAKMKQVMKNPRWMAWMKTTDTNFGTECATPARGAITAVNDLDARLNDIDNELDQAS